MYTLKNGVSLCNGDIVEVSFNEEPSYFLMVMDTYSGDNYKDVLVECSGSNNSWMDCESLDAPYADIKKVYRPGYKWFFPFIRGKFDLSRYSVIYDDTPKELTVDEISRLLGYKVNVVGEDK